ncbi:MAG: hypothetical protein WDK96_01170 [Candidatus Paceibacterota bacterium]|jgi:hypothetical protein
MKSINIFPQKNSGAMDLKNPKNKLRIILLIVALTALLVVGYLLLRKPVDMNNLNEQQKLDILKDLSDSSKDMNLTTDQKAKILNNLSSGTVKNTSGTTSGTTGSTSGANSGTTKNSDGLTDQQKLDLLNSLKNL